MSKINKLIIAVFLAIFFYSIFIFDTSSARLEDSVVKIVTEKSTGTGFFIEAPSNLPKGVYILTSQHVIKHKSKIRIFQMRDYSSISHEAITIKADIEQDLALLWIDSKANYPTLKIYKDYSFHIESGDPVIVIGYPYGFGSYTTTGVVSRVTPGEVWTDAAVASGSSGSPVIREGEVIGIVKSTVTKRQGYTVAVDFNTIWRFLE
jgi:S1-C subfamily serine protease